LSVKLAPALAGAKAKDSLRSSRRA
jgi:hypothetical protein